MSGPIPEVRIPVWKKLGYKSENEMKRAGLNTKIFTPDQIARMFVQPINNVVMIGPGVARRRKEKS